MSRLLFFAMCAVLLTGCAPALRPLDDPNRIVRAWTALTLSPPSDERLTAGFSLQIDTPKRRGRLLGQIWGYPASVIRLDLSSGTGMAVALIRESVHLWAAYLPSENKAYHHAVAREGLRLFHIPVPFTVRQVSSLLQGNLGPLIPDSYATVEETREKHLRFSFAEGEIDTVEMDDALSMLIVRGKEKWTLLCEMPYTSPNYPQRQLWKKFTFLTPRDGKAILRLKSLEPNGVWDEAALDLRPPQDVQWLELTTETPTN